MHYKTLERAKAMLSGRWIYGSIERHLYGTCLINNVHVVNETAGRFTGIRDNTQWGELTETQRYEFVQTINQYEHCLATMETGHLYWHGKLIFEGDIVRCSRIGTAITGIVTQHDNEWGVVAKNEFISFSRMPMHIFKVVGNAHDNPEMMENI